MTWLILTTILMFSLPAEGFEDPFKNSVENLSNNTPLICTTTDKIKYMTICEVESLDIKFY